MHVQAISNQPVGLTGTPASGQTPANTPEKTAAPAPAKAPTDTVTISSAGKAALAEAMETAAQTAREARGGDHQAQRLQARIAASHEHA